MSLRIQLAYPLPDSKKFYETLFSKDGKFFERNGVNTSVSSEPKDRKCYPICASKSLVQTANNGEYVCKNDFCKDCGSVVKERAIEIRRIIETRKELTQAEKDALELSFLM